ncbi:response regulator [Roseovarius sp. SCSIO 43702]|uniref:response regulator n=1 Tax=Roseovarius sp. SCSIO 43702 TaxID=2823043 RepID=UPI001C72CA27|nr:response regulator [Roseovarius sp. SCSIO 43702]QYX56448.1 response regulator [Roseovarius sp. SCSIO 43702]
MSKAPPPLILVVEDEAALRGDIVEELQEAGYRTAAAPDGHAALALLADVAPDLVLCDITMPGLDGYGLLATLRERHPDLAEVPFVFLTALSDPRDVVEGKLMGADDYLVKPVDYDLMLATIAARLRQVARIRQSHGGEVARLRDALSGLSGGGAERALDLVALGIVLLDGRGRVLHANRAARAMAGAGDFITLHGGRIGAAETACDHGLRQAMEDAREAAQTGADRVIGTVLENADDARTVSALVCALPHDPAYPSAEHRVAVFLSPPARERRVSEPLLMDLFGLTPTETRVAAALAAGARPATIAEELGVSQTTIAFHMRNLFEKTGTNRQIDLVALILAGPMMIDTV